MPRYLTTLVRLYRNRTEPESLVVLSRHVWHVELAAAVMCAVLSVALGVFMWTQHPQRGGEAVSSATENLKKENVATIAGVYMKRLTRESEVPALRAIPDPSVVKK